LAGANSPNISSAISTLVLVDTQGDRASAARVVPVGDHRRLHDLLLELRARADEPSLRKIHGASGVSIGHLSEIFAGKAAPGPDVAARIAQALKATGREQAQVRFYAEGVEADRSAQRTADTGSERRSGRNVVRVGRVPRQAAWFQDRHARIDLARTARAGRTAVLTQVLSGLGGVGKTQLAAQFARRLDAAGELDVLVWVTASSRDAIIAAYTETARAVHVCGADVDPQAAAVRLLNWLEHTDQRWLIVLDNLDLPADASGLWPPENQHARTVITTRRRDPILHTDGRTLITVDLFTAGEATDYLARATGAPREQHADVRALATDLGHLPLAIAQAAAFIRDRGISCAAYRQRLAGRRDTLDSLAPPADARPDDYQPTVAATWSLSVDAANIQPPHGLARPLLDLAALLNPNGIPAALFTTAAVATHLTTVLDHDVTAEEICDGLRNLHRLHLITHDPETGIVRVHALVQRATRDQLDPGRLAAAAHAAADALHQLWPDPEPDAGTAQPLRANTIILRQYTDHLLWTTADGAHPVLFLAGASLGETGQVNAARD
jgi:transcriptional regulator with XRE-family HTH domain